mgnify:CR=1 FL=1
MGLQSASGGLTKSKLELATAVPGDVVAGKTFYAGDKNLKTGTLVERGTAQNAGGIGSGGSGSSAYIAFNRIPEGIYRANGTDWGPEIRALRTDVVPQINLVRTQGVNRGVYGNDTYSVTLNQEIKNGLLFISSGRGATDACQIDSVTINSGSLSTLNYTKFTGHDGNIALSGIYQIKNAPSGAVITARGWGMQTACVYQVVKLQ